MRMRRIRTQGDGNKMKYITFNAFVYFHLSVVTPQNMTGLKGIMGFMFAYCSGVSVQIQAVVPGVPTGKEDISYLPQMSVLLTDLNSECRPNISRNSSWLCGVTNCCCVFVKLKQFRNTETKGSVIRPFAEFRLLLSNKRCGVRFSGMFPSVCWQLVSIVSVASFKGRA